MSVSLSPSTVLRAREAQLFVTVDLWPNRRLPLRPIAPRVEWDPAGASGVALAVLCVDAAGDTVQRWECRNAVIHSDDCVTVYLESFRDPR